MDGFLLNLLGWTGAFLLLLAYVLVSFKKIKPDSETYQWLNASASILLAINTLYHQAYPSSFVNIIWAVIAFIAILTIKRSYGKSTG